jgi:hypothetical protein
LPATVVDASDAFASDPTPGATAIAGYATALTGAGWGVFGGTESGDSDAYGVYGRAISANGGQGVLGTTAGVLATAHGVLGLTSSSTGNAQGVEGLSSSPSGIGVYGADVSTSNTGAGSSGVGVWGDNGSGGLGVLGTSDNSTAGAFYNNSPGGAFTLIAGSFNVPASPFYAYNSVTSAYCDIDYDGNLNCTGAKHAVVAIDGGQRKVRFLPLSLRRIGSRTSALRSCRQVLLWSLWSRSSRKP